MCFFFITLLLAQVGQALPSRSQIVRRGLLRFLDEAVQQYHHAFVDGEQDPGDALGDMGPDLISPAPAS
jgi:hypothetical protein